MKNSPLDSATKIELMEMALAARSQAYAPYSKFSVGAAVLTLSGAFYRGCNIENASFGLTLCAERIAYGNAIAAGDSRFVAICIASEKGIPPCGACRQFMYEFGSQLEIVLVDSLSSTVRLETSLQDLFPQSFVFRRSE